MRSRPLLVGAARIQRIAREVEVVLVALGREIVGCGRDLHEIAAPRAAQRDGRLVEQGVDVDRLVRLAGAARLLLRDEPHGRREALGERLLVAQRGGGQRGQGECDPGHERQRDPERARPSAHSSGLEANRSRPSRPDRKRAASCPLTLLPAASSGGANVPSPPLPGETVTIPPPIPLLPGRPTS